jgi:hypothetical protein
MRASSSLIPRTFKRNFAAIHDMKVKGAKSSASLRNMASSGAVGVRGEMKPGSRAAPYARCSLFIFLKPTCGGYF